MGVRAMLAAFTPRSETVTNTCTCTLHRGLVTMVHVLRSHSASIDEDREPKSSIGKVSCTAVCRMRVGYGLTLVGAGTDSLETSMSVIRNQSVLHQMALASSICP